jgi:hypothetical protein
MFEKEIVENPEFNCAVLRESLPLVYSSLKEHQEADALCKELWGKVQQAQGGAFPRELNAIDGSYPWH